jgi:hypothetical protein
MAKLWISAQLANRIKYPGQRNQTRWDYGLTKAQARQLRTKFLSLRALKAAEEK